MSISVLSMLRTRSDSSTQSARASRAAAGSALLAQGQFGGAAQAGQRRAQIVGHVVHGFAHGADEGLVFVKQSVEQPHQFVQFVARGAGGDAGVEIARAQDVPGGGDDLPDGQQGAMGKETAKNKAEQGHGDDDGDDRPPHRFPEQVAVVGAAAHHQERAVGHLHRGKGEILFRVFRARG